MKRILAMLLTVLLIVTMLPVTALPISAEETEPKMQNITDQAKVYSGADGKETTKPVDNAPGTYQDISWQVSGVTNVNCYVKLDFGSPVYFSRIEVMNYNQDSYYQWEAYGSDDGENWELICEKKDNALSRVNGVQMTYGFTFEEVCYRYVKVQGTYHSKNVGYHFNEIDVYSEHPNVAFKKPVVAGSGVDASKIVDGETGAYVDMGHWGEIAGDPTSATGLDGTCYAEIDLQTVYDLSEIDVWNYVGRDYRFALYGSNDNTLPMTEWTLLCEKTDSAKTTAAGLAYEVEGSYRFIRAYGMYNASNVGFHFNEIKVFAAPADLTFLNVSPWLTGFENWGSGSKGLTTEILMTVGAFQLDGVNYHASDLLSADFPYGVQLVFNGGYYTNKSLNIKPSSNYGSDSIRFEPCIVADPFIPVKGEKYTITLNVLDSIGSVVATGTGNWTCPMSPVYLYDEGQTYVAPTTRKDWYANGEIVENAPALRPNFMPERYFTVADTSQFDLGYTFDFVLDDTVIYEDVILGKGYDWAGGKLTDDIIGYIPIMQEGLTLVPGETYSFVLNAYGKSYPSGAKKLEASYPMKDYVANPCTNNPDNAQLFWDSIPFNYSFDAVGGKVRVGYDPATLTYTLNADLPDADKVFFGWYLDGTLLTGETTSTYTFTAAEGDDSEIKAVYADASAVDTYTITYEVEYPDESVVTLYSEELPEGSTPVYNRSYQDTYTDGYMLYTLVVPEMTTVRGDATYRLTFTGTDTRGLTMTRWDKGIENWSEKTQFLPRLYDYTGAEVNLYSQKDSLRFVFTIDGVEYDNMVIGSYGGYAINRFTVCINEVFIPSCVAGTTYVVSIEAFDVTTGELKYYTVNSCEFVVPANFVPIHNHTYSEAVTTPATCTEAGVKTFTCTGCGTSYTEAIPATGEHSYVSEVTTAPGCVTEGVMTYTCSDCGATYTEAIPAEGHDYDLFFEIPASYFTEGEKAFVCTKCDDSYTETIPAQTTGSGTEEDPYIIATAADLIGLETYVNGGTGWGNNGDNGSNCSGLYFLQTADIDLTGVDFVPLGYWNAKFSGTYNGGNHTISNLKADHSSGYTMGGFIATGNGATVCNVVFDGITVTGANNVGCVIGNGTDCTLDHVTVKNASASSSGDFVGGFIGCGSNVTFNDVTLDGADIYGATWYVGGVAGKLTGSSVTNLVLNGDISVDGMSRTGGVFGYLVSSSVTNVGASEGSIYMTATGEDNGCIIGRCDESALIGASIGVPVTQDGGASGGAGIVGGVHGDSTFSDIVFTGGISVKSAYNVSPLFGKVYNGVLTASNCVAACECQLVDVIINPASVIGEVADGAEAKLNNCYSPAFKTPVASGKERTTVGAVVDENGNYIDGMFFTSEVTVADGFSLVKNLEENYYYVVADGVSGSGTEADPYLIGSAPELRWFANYVNASTNSGSDGHDCAGLFFKLTADIDLGGSYMLPIGYWNGIFKGTFDGSGYTIKNAVIDHSSGWGMGFFGTMDGATLKNLTLDNVSVMMSTGVYNTGILVGKITGAPVTFTNVIVKGDRYILTGGNNVGTLVGSVETELLITCDSDVPVYPAYMATAYGEATTEVAFGAGNADDITIIGHEYDETSNTATCTEDGVSTSTCVYCGKTTEEPAPAHGHSYVDGVCEYCGEPDPDAVTVIAKIGDVEYETLAEAIAAAQPGDTIVLIDDVTLAGNDGVTIPAGKEITLDLNGCTLSNLVSENRSSQVILNKGELTITDSSEAGTGKITNAVAEGTAAGDWWSTPQYNYATNVITNSGTLTVKGGIIEETAASSICYAVDNNSTNGNATLIIEGGQIVKNTGSAVRLFANSTTYECSIVMTGGIISGGYAGFWIQLPGSSGQAKKVSLSISGGTVAGTNTDESYPWYDYSFGDVFDAVEYEITGGRFIGTEGIYSYGVEGFISGGIFDAPVPAEYCAEGYAPAMNGDGQYTVEEKAPAAAKIGDVEYETLAEAIAAAQPGDTITVLIASETAVDLNDGKVYLFISDEDWATRLEIAATGLVVMIDDQTSQEYDFQAQGVIGDKAVYGKIEPMIAATNVEYGTNSGKLMRALGTSGYVYFYLYEDWTLEDDVTLQPYGAAASWIYTIGDFTIDLNGKQIDQISGFGNGGDVYATNNGWAAVEVYYGSLEIKDSVGEGKIIGAKTALDVQSDASATLTSGTLSSKAIAMNKNGSGRVVAIQDSSSSFTMNGGLLTFEFLENGTEGEVANAPIALFASSADAEVVINGGTIKALPIALRSDPTSNGVVTGKDVDYSKATIIYSDGPIAGDINGDGTLSIADVTALLAYIASADAEGIDLEIADLFEDGCISIRDVTVLLSMIAG